MTFLKPVTLICASLLALAAAPASAGDASSVQKTFDAGTTEWVAAYNAGNVDRILALYDGNATILPPDGPAAAGTTAMRGFLTKDVAASKAAGVHLAIANGGAGVSGDLGWHSGTFAVLDEADKPTATGKYLEVWQKQHGKWAIIRDIWNNDAPSAPMTAASAPASP